MERRIARGDADFPAVVCSLGLLGVITRVRFRLVDELYFDVVQKVVELDDVLADLDATSAQLRLLARQLGAEERQGAALGGDRDPARAVEAGRRLPGGPAPSSVLDVVFEVLDKLADTGPLLNGALELVYDVMALTYNDSRATGPLRNMLPVDRRAPLRVAMAEWSFRPQDLQRVLGECERVLRRARLAEHPHRDRADPRRRRADVAVELGRASPYVVKFNFMYLTEVCTEPGEKEAIYAHLRGLWEHLQAAGVPFKAHWGKINFIDPEFVRRNHGIDAFRPLISPLFMNDYLAERIGPARGAVHA